MTVVLRLPLESIAYIKEMKREENKRGDARLLLSNVFLFYFAFLRQTLDIQ